MVLIPEEIFPTTKAGESFSLLEISTLFITG